MKVFVTGGTGALGRPTIPALISAGHTVTALARTPAKAAALAGQGATPVQVSLFDRSALAAAFEGHSAVINLATAIPPMNKFLSSRAWRSNDRVRVEGSAAVVDAAVRAGVARVIQESVCMVYRSQGRGWVDELSPVDDFPMTRGNLAAEANNQRFTGTGVVLRFGWFYGPGAAHSEQMFAQARRHIGMVLGRADGYVSVIHMTDAASAVVAALSAPAGIYNVVDNEPLTKRAFAQALASASGTAMWVRGPGRGALLLGARLTSLTRSSRVTNAKFRNATGWSPKYPSAREGWLATAVAAHRPRP
jgi:nucleoside-diphosphate-sugar epimerase